ncbi:MAG: DUF255 domain-containing protein [Fimbriimonadales bacterium]
MANRLADESSPYLLQHKDNPVDWYPWGEEAFGKAKADDKPVFLSVGYSSCHWCHVMEHESFENEDVASVLNESFVSIKVDREERPDVDEAYMAAVQLSSGRGGWPMTVFLTPDKKPFFAGTYFPREDRGNQAGLLTICRQIALLWKSKREEIEENAAEFVRGVGEAIGRTTPKTFSRFDEAFLANAAQALAGDFDEMHGGFGHPPKFPPHTAIDLLLSYAELPTTPPELQELAIGMAFSTLGQMALGGIRDHVGGGFHRYSTDERWLVPHFEKMLYDNALMLENYARAATMLHGVDRELEDLFRMAASETARWACREMRAPDGSFYSALDADSEGEEGKFYVWRLAEVREVLSDSPRARAGSRARKGELAYGNAGEDAHATASAFIAAYGLREEGNYRDEATGRMTGENILNRLDGESVNETFVPELKELLTARERRVRPGLDDKVLVSWNGLAIRALANSGFLKYAAEAADAILAAEESHGALPHQIVKGTASGRAFLDGYAAFADGLFAVASRRAVVEGALHGNPGDGAEYMGKLDAKAYREHAERLTREMIELFWDEKEGGFFGTSRGHEELFGRSKPTFDSPVPSGNSLALRCLAEIGDLDRAHRLVTALLGWMERAPQATEALSAAAISLLGAQVAPGTDRGTVWTGGTEVAVSLEPREIGAGHDGTGRGEIIITIPMGLHINSATPPARWMAPTKLDFAPIKAEVGYPPADGDVYRGEVRIPFTVHLPAGSGGEEFEVRVSYQACTDSECQLPAEKVLSGVVVRG